MFLLVVLADWLVSEETGGPEYIIKHVSITFSTFPWSTFVIKMIKLKIFRNLDGPLQPLTRQPTKQGLEPA